MFSVQKSLTIQLEKVNMGANILFNKEEKSQLGGLDGQSGLWKTVYYGDEMWISW